MTLMKYYDNDLKGQDTGKIIISVVIIAYNRENFVLDALDSLDAQTLDHELFEVIIVSNFDLSGIEKFDSTHIKHIKMGDGSIGLYFKTGIENAKGEVICLLEDDDLFEKEKLQRVFQIYKKEVFDYYKNGKIHVTLLNEPTLAPKFVAKFPESGYIIAGLDKYKTRRINDMGGHPSTISFRKALLVPYLGKMKYVTSEIGYFIYYIALQHNGRIILDSSILTRYRISPESDSKSLIDPKRNVEIRKRHLFRTFDSLQVLYSIVSSPKVLAELKCEVAFLKCEIDYYHHERPALKEFVLSIRFILDSTQPFKYALKSVVYKTAHLVFATNDINISLNKNSHP